MLNIFLMVLKIIKSMHYLVLNQHMIMAQDGLYFVIPMEERYPMKFQKL